MANQTNENSQHQDNNDDFEDKLYKQLEEKLDNIEEEFEQNVKNNIENKLETNKYQSDAIDIEESSEEVYEDIPLRKIETEPTFKNTYTEKISTASKKREEALEKQPNKYLKYAGIGTEMIGSVILGGFAGNWLDKKMEYGFPIFTITLIFLGLTATFVHLIRQLNADQKEEKNTKNTKN